MHTILLASRYLRHTVHANPIRNLGAGNKGIDVESDSENGNLAMSNSTEDDTRNFLSKDRGGDTRIRQEGMRPSERTAMRSETNSHAASAGPVILSSADENLSSPENDSELMVNFAASPPDAETPLSATTSVLVDASR